MVVLEQTPVDPWISVNGRRYSVGTAGADASLLEFLRENCQIKSAKRMCNEGGCGSCVVSATRVNSATGEQEVFSVNSCLIPVHNAHSWEFTTTEDLGGKKTSYHSLQKRLADGHGSQCGFCSPGLVMTVNSLLAGKPEGVTIQEVERDLDGNICRCTGYRAILDAFKSIATDAPDEMKAPFCDIEDAVPVCPLTKTKCNGKTEEAGSCKNGSCSNGKAVEPPGRFSSKDGITWLYPSSFQELIQTLQDSKNASEYKLVCGNTGKGVYNEKREISVYISLNNVPELYSVEVGEEIRIGGCVSMSKFIEVVEKTASLTGFSYCSALAEHVQNVANRGIRNVGSLAGNLMLKYFHPEFPSDIFVILETVGAFLKIVSINGEEKTIQVEKMLSEDMKDSVISTLCMRGIFWA